MSRGLGDVYKRQYEYSCVGYEVDSKLVIIQIFTYLPHMNMIAWKERVSVENFCA